MAKKKKAYRRFEELTRKAMAPMTDPDQGSVNLEPGGGGGVGSAPSEALPIWLSPEVRRALEQQAAADHTTPSEIIEHVLRRYLEVTGNGFPPPR